jgi:hypothetical protein
MIYTSTLRNLLANAMGGYQNGGKIELRKADETLIARMNPLPGPAYNTAPATATGVITANAIPDGTVGASETIDHATFFNSAGAELFELSVSITGGAGELELSAIAVTIGDVISITDGTITQPAS